jgi:wobble nucleotide-excising tRNase
MAILKKFSRLESLSTFDDYAHTAGVPEFCRYNLIYGFNGSGKTTLSRLLRQLEIGALPADWSAATRFSIELDDGTSITHAAGIDTLKDRLFVFNVDFIEEHLNWKDGKASPIFYIGKAQAELGEQLRSKEADIGRTKLQVITAREVANAQDQRFATVKRDAARVIAAELNLGRSYNATNLDADYATWTDDATHILADQLREQLRATLNLPAPRPKLAPLTMPSGKLADLARTLQTLLSKTVGVLALEELREHPSMLGWLRTGLDYHSEKSLNDCLFCGNEIPPDRMDNLRAAIDDRFDRLMSEIRAARDDVFNRRDQWRRVETAIPSIGALAPGLEADFDEVKAQLIDTLGEIDAVFEHILPALERKLSDPNTATSLPDGVTVEKLAKIDAVLFASVTAIGSVIDRHNRTHGEFEQSKAAAADRLKRHLLAEGSAGFREVKEACATATAQAITLEESLKKLEAEALNLRARIREHGPAAEGLTKGIGDYLGHDYLEVRAEDGEEGYRIYRRGVAVKGCLSEGEKTAIALVYFISRLTAENRKLEDLIVIVDDPVSSLDSRALNYAFNLMRKALSDAAQVVIFTHNLALMNEIKKWLRRKVDKGKAAWLMVDCQQDAAGVRTSRLVALPKLLAEHESEYHYLFKVTHDFAAYTAAYHPYLYLMPNALRKVLEIFLTFKFPDVKDIASLVEKAETVGGTKIDPARLKALERLVQVESHGDNLDDLVSMSPMTIEETRGAALALLDMMGKLDETHVAGMKKMCA